MDAYKAITGDGLYEMAKDYGRKVGIALDGLSLPRHRIP